MKIRSLLTGTALTSVLAASALRADIEPRDYAIRITEENSQEQLAGIAAEIVQYHPRIEVGVLESELKQQFRQWGEGAYNFSTLALNDSTGVGIILERSDVEGNNYAKATFTIDYNQTTPDSTGIAPLAETLAAQTPKVATANTPPPTKDTTLNTEVILPDTASRIPDEELYTKTPSPSKLALTGLKLGYSGLKAKKGEIGLVFGDKVLVSASYGVTNNTRDPNESEPMYGTPDPFLGTRAVSVIDTTSDALESVRTFKAGYIFSKGNIETTVALGLQQETRSIEGNSYIGEVDKNNTPLINGYKKTRPFSSKSTSNNPTLGLGLEYMLNENNLVGVLGNVTYKYGFEDKRKLNAELGATYRRRF